MVSCRFVLPSLLLIFTLTGCQAASAPAPPAKDVDPIAAAARLPATDPPRPSPTVTPQPTSTQRSTATPLTGQACLSGRWELRDLAGFFQATLDASGNPLAFVNGEGRLEYEFSGDGIVNIHFDKLAVDIEGAYEGEVLPARSELDGRARAKYEPLNHQDILLSDFGSEQVNMRVYLAGQILLDEPLPAWETFFYGLSAASGSRTPPEEKPLSAAIHYSCSGDALTLAAADMPAEMRFKRLP